MVTLSWVLTSISKPFFMVRRLTVAALRSMNGTLACRPAPRMALKRPRRSMIMAFCCFTTKNALKASTIRTTIRMTAPRPPPLRKDMMEFMSLLRSGWMRATRLRPGHDFPSYSTVRACIVPSCDERSDVMLTNRLPSVHRSRMGTYPAFMTEGNRVAAMLMAFPERQNICATISGL